MKIQRVAFSSEGMSQHEAAILDLIFKLAGMFLARMPDDEAGKTMHFIASRAGASFLERKLELKIEKLPPIDVLAPLRKLHQQIGDEGIARLDPELLAELRRSAAPAGSASPRAPRSPRARSAGSASRSKSPPKKK